MDRREADANVAPDDTAELVCLAINGLLELGRTVEATTASSREARSVTGVCALTW